MVQKEKDELGKLKEKVDFLIKESKRCEKAEIYDPLDFKNTMIEVLEEIIETAKKLQDGLLK